MVSTHSKHNKKYMIFSVFLSSDCTNTSHTKHDKLVNNLKKHGIGFKVVYGVYKNVKELSIVTEYNSELVDLIFNKYSQESILVLENHKHGLYKATLVFNNSASGEHQDLGYFRSVNKERALKEDCYTVDGDDYYITTTSDSVIQGGY